MNKKIIVIVGIVIVICAIAFGFIIKNNNKVVVPGEEVSQSLSEKVVINSKDFSYKVSNFDVEMKIPEFANLSTSFNTYINNKINSDISYINVYNEMTSGIEDKSTIGKFSYKVTYERYNCGDFVSIMISQRASLEGSREKSLGKYYVIDVKNNKTALLQDLMANKSDYRRKVKTEVETQAFKANIELKGGNDIGTIQDTQKFYIKDDILHICFDAGEISAVSNGVLDFEMPFRLENGLFTY